MQSTIVFEQAAPNHAISVRDVSVVSRAELPAKRLWVKCCRRGHSISGVRANMASRRPERTLRLRLGLRIRTLREQGAKLTWPKMMDRTSSGMIAVCRRIILGLTSGACARRYELVAASDEG